MCDISKVCMQHAFVTTYFNYNNYTSREVLTKEFLTRYPNVWLLEVTFGFKPFIINHAKTMKFIKQNPSFYTWELLNKFVLKYPHFSSVTLIDCDLILPPNYFERIVDKIEDLNPLMPYVIQGFSRCKEIPKNKGVSIVEYGIIKKFSDYKILSGESGFIWTFNKRTIEILFPLPTNFYIGGMDYILALCLLRDERVLELIPSYNLINFYMLFEEIQYSYVIGLISHCYSSNKALKHPDERWGLYQNIDLNIIKNYFIKRREDD